MQSSVSRSILTYKEQDNSASSTYASWEVGHHASCIKKSLNQIETTSQIEAKKKASIYRVAVVMNMMHKVARWSP